MTATINEPLDAENFRFWTAPAGMTLTTGEDTEIAVPEIPLPIKTADLPENGAPSEKAIGDGLYEYLCRFDFCEHAREYALILQQAYPFLISDIGSQLILLDVKSVAAEGLRRKIALLKILHHLDPASFGLCHKIGVANFDLAMTYSELDRIRPSLGESRAWLEKARRQNGEDVGNLNLLGQVCYLSGSYHQSRLYWKKAAELMEEGQSRAELLARLARIDASRLPEKPLAESLELIAAALGFLDAEDFPRARELMETLDAVGELPRELPNPEFFYLLGFSREKCDDLAGAYEGYKMALSLDEKHEASKVALERVTLEQRG